MRGNPLNGGDSGPALGATALSPADFPLGSPQSRAATRVLLAQRRPKFSGADRDALILYAGAHWINRSMEPDGLEHTAAYQRGRKLHDERHGPVIPAHLDPHYKRSTQASLRFELVFGREPKPGDSLRYIDVERSHEAFLSSIGDFIGAWRRQIPDMLCPLKIEDGRLYHRLRRGACWPGNEIIAIEGEWREAIDQSPQRWWSNVERDVGEVGLGVNLAEMPRVSAVVFSGVVDGQHRCRPATEEDLT